MTIFLIKIKKILFIISKFLIFLLIIKKYSKVWLYSEETCLEIFFKVGNFSCSKNNNFRVLVLLKDLSILGYKVVYIIILDFK